MPSKTNLNVIFSAICMLLHLEGGQGSIDIIRCPLYHQYFQKVLGYRPDFQLIGNTHDLLRPPTTTLSPNGNDINATLFSQPTQGNVARLDDADSTDQANNIDCWLRCKSDIECSGYVLFLNVSRCFGLTFHDKSSKLYTPIDSDRLVLDTNAVYFEKICLTNVPENYRQKLWLFTKIPGTNLMAQGKKTLPMLVTRSRCAEQCLLETEFPCLSASFVASHKNNVIRAEQINSLPDESHDLGTCMLSPKDKSTQPDAFRVSTNDEEYIENQCSARTSEADSCAYEVHPNSRLIYAELETRQVTQTQCKQKCVEESRFFCQGISFTVLRNGTSRCLLHSEDVISLGPRSLLHDANFVYERRVKCLNVSVLCTRSQMTVTYTPFDWFNGRIYVNAHSDECSSQGLENKAAVLRMAIGTEAKERRCGIMRAYQIEKESHTNRTLLSALAVIQMNPIVQTQGDRLVKVGCIIDNNLRENGMIDDISLASSLAFTQTDTPNEGSLIINTTGTAPRVSLRVVDLSENAQINDVALGQNLELQIRLTPADSAYDFRAVKLIARSNTGHSSILLLDNRGCPTDLSIFPQLQRRTSNTIQVLFGRFHAFKFAGSSYVNFEVVVQFCLGKCATVSCGPNAKDVQRRRRRDILDGAMEAPAVQYGQPFAVFGGDTSPHQSFFADVDNRPSASAATPSLHSQTEYNQIQVQSIKEAVSQRVLSDIADDIVAANVTQTSRSTFNGNRRILKQLEELPLQFQLNVRVPDTSKSESLIYGESGHVLSAGIAVPADSNFVCMNRTFLILLLVVWLLLQTILITVCCIMVRKYRRLANIEEDQRSLERVSSSEFDSRKVRWADQNGSRVLMFTN